MYLKNHYRKSAIEKRALLSKNEIINRSHEIYNRIFSLPEIIKAKNIFCYLSSINKNEIDTYYIISELIKKNKQIFIPKTVWNERKLKIFHLDEFPLDRNKFIMKYDILEPIDKYFNEISGKELDILILPGTAVDKNGTRYGYGGGFFDKLLLELTQINKKFFTLFPIFSCQVFPEIPKEKHDIPVDIIITDIETIYTANYNLKSG